MLGQKMRAFTILINVMKLLLKMVAACRLLPIIIRIPLPSHPFLKKEFKEFG